MGFSDLPQYTSHEIKGGYCVRCNLALPYEGTITYRPAFGAHKEIIYIGDLQPATPCVKG